MPIDRALRVFLFALTLSAASCGSDDDKPKTDAAPAADGSGGGADLAVSADTGGSSDRAVSPDAAVTPGADAAVTPGADATVTPGADGGTPGAPSVAKFCNSLARAGMAVMLTIEIGSPPVRLTALTGQCAPMVPMACPMIPSGMVPIRVLDDAMMPLLQGTADVMPASEYLFLASFNTTMMRPQLQFGPFMPQFKCATSDPAARPDGGTMTGDGGTMTGADGGS